MREAFLLYGHYVSIHVKSIMQYKISFLLSVMGQFLVSFNVFLGMFFMFQRFSCVGGFTYSQVLLWNSHWQNVLPEDLTPFPL